MRFLILLVVLLQPLLLLLLLPVLQQTVPAANARRPVLVCRPACGHLAGDLRCPGCLIAAQPRGSVGR